MSCTSLDLDSLCRALLLPLRNDCLRAVSMNHDIESVFTHLVQLNKDLDHADGDDGTVVPCQHLMGKRFQNTRFIVRRYAVS